MYNFNERLLLTIIFTQVCHPNGYARVFVTAANLEDTCLNYLIYSCLLETVSVVHLLPNARGPDFNLPEGHQFPTE
jgi:hypothetical protein